MAKNVLFTSLMLLLCYQNVVAQIKKNDSLYVELQKQDSMFFERSFNQCDLVYLEKKIAKDLSFYHDISGFQDREAFFTNVKKYICSGLGKKPIRRLEEGSLEVYPLYASGVLYGAIQHGVHHFYMKDSTHEEWTGTAKFTSVWVLQNGNWMLSTVLSYNHEAPKLSRLRRFKGKAKKAITSP